MLLALLVLASTSLADFAFMAGYWRGEAGERVIEEVWLPAEGDAMHSVFRMVSGGKTRFTEYQSIEMTSEGPVLHLRHYHPGLVGWEDKNGALRWTVESLGKDRAVFKQQNAETRLEYIRQGDALTVTLIKEGKRQPFAYKLVKDLAR